jgi:hypothetical protein
MVVRHIKPLQRRLKELETLASAGDTAMALATANDPRLERLQRLRIALNRELRQTLDMLRKLQGARPRNEKVPEETHATAEAPECQQPEAVEQPAPEPVAEKPVSAPRAAAGRQRPRVQQRSSKRSSPITGHVSPNLGQRNRTATTVAVSRPEVEPAGSAGKVPQSPPASDRRIAVGAAAVGAL